MKILKLIGVVALFCCICADSLASNSSINAMQTQKKTMILNQLKSKDLISTEIKKLGDSDKNEVLCLALNIYNEARGSSVQDQIASSYTVFNRMNDDEYPLFYPQEKKSICNVIFDRYQYCWTNPETIKIPQERKAWQDAQYLAYKLYTQPIHKELSKMFEIKHYVVQSMVNQSNKPKWINNRKFTIDIGAHSYMLLKNPSKTKEELRRQYDNAITRGYLAIFNRLPKEKNFKKIILPSIIKK